MSLSPRLYAGLEDFKHLDAVLTAGMSTAICTHYVHPGDLRWWLFYTFPENQPWANLYLWEDEGGRVTAWTLFSPNEEAVDLFYLPELHDTPEMRRMLAWSVDGAASILRGLGVEKLKKYWVRDQDAVLSSALESLGFAPGQDTSVHMTRRLNGALPEPVLPAGFTLRACRGLEDIDQRAAVQHNAFESDLPMQRYLERFRHYMSSPAYVPMHDVVIQAPDGRMVAFAKTWPDAATGVGNFEPVGVHQEFQRRGLGRAVMLAGLHCLQQWGMKSAQVGTGSANLPAIRLYEAVGFRVEWISRTYEKEITVSGKIP